MSATLSKKLRLEHSVRSMPVRKDDEVVITRGKFAKTQGKVTAVYRKRRVVHIAGVTRERNAGFPVNVGIDASNVQITKLYMDPGRKAILARKSRAQGADKKEKGAEVAGAKLD